MKKIKFLGFVIFFLFTYSISSVSAVTLSFNPAAISLEVGEMFNVDLEISGGELELDYGSGGNDLSEFDLYVGYNASLLSFNSYVLGDQLGEVGIDADDLSWGDVGGGLINLCEFSWLADFSFQADSFSLAKLFFTADRIGETEIYITLVDSLTLGDPGGEPLTIVPIDLQSVSISITENSSAVPEPSTIMLLGTGLLGLGAAVKRGRKNV